jgi:2-keto-4-pentenoate hydratase/2-oxohepta-3-ene-1,7-dioic acid hydratase in catechol pathway
MIERLPAPFCLGTFSATGAAPFPGLVLPTGDVVPVSRLGQPLERMASTLALLADWPEAFAALKAIVSTMHRAEATARRDLGAVGLESLHVHAPVLPRQIFCTVANFRSHIVDTVRGPGPAPQLGAADTPECLARARVSIEERARGVPYVCLKLPSTVIGPTDPFPVPKHAQKTDWELELAAVIGRPCRRATRENAMDFVAGYTLVNDITLRELVARPDLPRLGADWLQSKNGPGFLPTGPFLVPAAFVCNPYAVRLQLRLNGALMQNEVTSDMIFDIATQIEYVSRHAQLLPGDLICTGTPAGCGTRYQRFLQPGDVLECSADGFGVQRTSCVSEEDGNETSQSAGCSSGRAEGYGIIPAKNGT